MMVVLVERLLPSDYFTDGLTGVRVDSEILVDLMKERLPSLHAHLKKHELLMLLPMVTTLNSKAIAIRLLKGRSSCKSCRQTGGCIGSLACMDRFSVGLQQMEIGPLCLD